MTSDHTQRSGLVEWMAMTVDCPEPNIMADFYAALLGGTVTSRIAGEAKLDAAGRLIYFRATPDYRPPTWPSPEAHQDPSDPHMLVMLDPAGHPFCLIRSIAAGRY